MGRVDHRRRHCCDSGQNIFLIHAPLLLRLYLISGCFYSWCEKWDSNPHAIAGAGPKPGASAYSAILAVIRARVVDGMKRNYTMYCTSVTIFTISFFISFATDGDSNLPKPFTVMVSSVVSY